MRTKAWLWVFSAAVVPVAFIACGDDTINDGVGASGATTSSSTPTTTTGSNTTSSSSSGTPIVGVEKCPGDPAGDLVRDSSDHPGDHATVIHDTTVGKADDLQAFCTDPSTSPDVVYKFNIADSCVLDIKLDEEGSFDGAFSFRTVCDTRTGSVYDCENKNTHGEEYKTFVDPGTYYVVVDGTAGADGAYTLTLDCAVPVCGDGVIGPEEQCDGGPDANPGDGCGDPGSGDGACKFENTASSDTCTNVPTIAVTGTATYTPADPAPPYTTVGAADDFQGTPTCDLNAGGADRVFQLQPSISGTMHITIGELPDGSNACDASPAACWNSVMYVRNEACAAGTSVNEIDCGFADYSDGTNAGSVYTLDVPNAVAGNIYTLVVDGAAADPNFDFGPFYLKLQVQ